MATRIPALQRPPQADEAGTEADPERDEILAAQVSQRLGLFGAFFFLGDRGEDLDFKVGIYKKAAIFKLYVFFPKCNNRFMMSKNFNWFPPKMMDVGWCWACFF